MKRCSKCEIEKDESDFYKDKRVKGGLNSRCKECINQRARERNARPETKERKKEYDAKYYAIPENKERKKQKQRERYVIPEVKERKKEHNAEYNTRPEIKERIKQNSKEYKARPEIKERNNQRAKERCQTDSCYKLRKCISVLIWYGLKKNGGSKRGSSILNKLPYSMQELKHHIESLFEFWMSWKNHGPYNPNRRTWQIDHIVPHSSFRYDNMDCEEFRQCWALSNLRPLETIKNLRKGNKIK